jgi:hypothetical protein
MELPLDSIAYRSYWSRSSVLLAWRENRNYIFGGYFSSRGFRILILPNQHHNTFFGFFTRREPETIVGVGVGVVGCS